MIELLFNIIYTCNVFVQKNVPELQGIQTLKNLRQFNLSINANNVSNFEIWRILSMLQAFPLLQKLTINVSQEG